MYHKYTGVVLKKYPFGEADELLTIYTREVGKLRVKAAGSRKIQSRLAGHLQSLNEIEFETAGRQHLRHRPTPALPVLISARALTVNNYLRENLKKFAYALIGIETLYRLSPDQEGNPEAYEALLDFLKKLGQSYDEKFQVRRLQLNLLKTAGFSLPIRRCLNCQDDLSGEASRVAYFVSAKGGFFCDTCVPGEKTDVALTAETFRQLSEILDGRRIVRLDKEVEQIIDGFLHYVLEREIKANGFAQTLNQEA